MSDQFRMDEGTKGEFEMLLDEVLDTVANPEPVSSLQEKVMMRLRMAEPEVAGPQLVVGSSKPTGVPRLFQTVSDKRDLGSMVYAFGIHAAAMLLIAFLIAQKVQFSAPVKEANLLSLDAPPPSAPPKAKIMGGGGGQKGPAPVSHGSPPKFSPEQLVPPKELVQAPKLAVTPTIDVDPHLKMDQSLPNIGMLNSPNVGVSMGNGNGSGLGSGNGNGMGPGSGGNTGGGVRQVGGGVSAPKLIYQPEAEFSEEARKAKVTGNVLVSLIVDESGNVIRAHVLKGVGMGLDEKALEAVRQYRFKPALENGKPVKVEVNVEVNFQIF
jgi:periplasmic protein TonB